MILKKISFLILIFIFAHKMYAQTSTFIKLYPLKPFPAAVFNGILVTDTAYFMIGIVSDSISPYGVKPLFVRTDTDGNIEVQKMHKDGNKSYETWHAGMYFDQNNNIVTNGYIFNNPDIKELFFVRYTQDGVIDTLVEFSYSNKFSDLPYPMLQSQSNQFIIPVLSFPDDRGTNVLFFLDKSGKVKKITKYNEQNGNLLYIRMDTTRNGFILGGWQAPPGPFKNGIHQTIISEFDTLGNKIWEYKSPTDEDWCGVSGGIISNYKNEVIYLSGQGYIYDPNTPSDYFHYKWYATKLDRDKKIVWRTFLPSFEDAAFEETHFWNILKLKEKNHYITMGMNNDRKTNIHGWMVKFNDDGEILWNRNYKIEGDSGYLYEIRDLAEDNEGNLIAVGERLDIIRGGINTQQALLLKLDKYGCLVPGCHIVSTKDEAKDAIDIKIYPNPATDFISFYLDQHSTQKVNQYCIRDMSGQLIKGMRPITSDINYIIHTHDFPSGIYIIQFLSNGQIVQAEKFIISH